LCHYPLMTWNGASRGRYMIHGHIHDNTAATTGLCFGICHTR
jgi:hypothetical protein